MTIEEYYKNLEDENDRLRIENERLHLENTLLENTLLENQFMKARQILVWWQDVRDVIGFGSNR